MKSETKILPEYELCEDCHKTFVKKVYQSNDYRILCTNCVSKSKHTPVQRAIHHKSVSRLRKISDIANENPGCTLKRLIMLSNETEYMVNKFFKEGVPA